MISEQAINDVAMIARNGIDRIIELESMVAAARDHAAALQAEVDRLRGLRPELPPYPPDGAGIPRFGLRWNGPDQPLSVPMDDGYWTPWHRAEAENARLREALAGLLRGVEAGRFVPYDHASTGYCESLVAAGERAIAALQSAQEIKP